MTPLAEDILSVFDRDPQKMVIWAGTATPGDFGSFAPRVFTHADDRDALAVPILLEAAADAARMINRLLDLGAPAIAMIGGIFPHLYPWLPPVLLPFWWSPRPMPSTAPSSWPGGRCRGSAPAGRRACESGRIRMARDGGPRA